MRKTIYIISNALVWVLIGLIAWQTRAISEISSHPRYIVQTNEIYHVVTRYTNSLENVTLSTPPSDSLPHCIGRVPFHSFSIDSRLYNCVRIDDGCTYFVGDETEYGIISAIYRTKVFFDDGNWIERENRVHSIERKVQNDGIPGASTA